MAIVLFLTSAFGAIEDAVHPDFDLSVIPFPAKYKTMGMDFLPDGRMVLVTTDFIGGGEVPPANPNHKVYLVEGATGANPNPQLTEIANNWLMPAGVTVANGKVYVSDRDGFYELLQLSAPADLNQNRKLIVKWPDEDKWNNGFQWHQFVFTPIFKQGFFYAPYSGSIRHGGWSNVNQTSSRSGAFLKWDLAGNLANFAGGLRSPNGAAFEEATGDIMVSDNQGSWLPASTLMLMKQGRFYGHSNVAPKLSELHPATVANWAETLPYEPPIAWLPHASLRASPSQPIAVKGTSPYAGHWLLGDVNNPGLVRIAVDKVDAGSSANGAVFWFSKGFKNAAINRLAYGPDGAIYIGTCMTIAGNWPGSDKQDIFRLAPKAAYDAFEMKAVRSLKDGLEIEFTVPVDPATVTAANFTAKQWQYIREVTYGAGKQPDQALTVSAAEASADGLRVHLKIGGLVKDRVVHVRTVKVKSAGGKTAWNDEAWFTHNTVSTREWNGSLAVRAPARASAMEGKFSHRIAGPGLLSVYIEARGAWKATLSAPDGSTLDAASGEGVSRIQLSGRAHAGLHFLRVSGAEGEAVRKVVF